MEHEQIVFSCREQRLALRILQDRQASANTHGKPIERVRIEIVHYAHAQPCPPSAGIHGATFNVTHENHPMRLYHVPKPSAIDVLDKLRPRPRRDENHKAQDAHAGPGFYLPATGGWDGDEARLKVPGIVWGYVNPKRWGVRVESASLDDQFRTKRLHPRILITALFPLSRPHPQPFICADEICGARKRVAVLRVRRRRNCGCSHRTIHTWVGLRLGARTCALCPCWRRRGKCAWRCGTARDEESEQEQKTKQRHLVRRRVRKSFLTTKQAHRYSHLIHRMQDFQTLHCTPTLLTATLANCPTHSILHIGEPSAVP